MAFTRARNVDMADVQYVKPGERAPSDGNRLVIKKLSGGQFSAEAYLGAAKAEIGFGVEDTLKQALVRAHGQAERLQISTIYVIGSSDAERS